MHLVDISDLIEKTFLIDKDNGEKYWAWIIELINKHEDNVKAKHRKFRCAVNNNEYEELITYAQVMVHIHDQEEDEVLWQFEKIVGHQGPLRPGNPG